MILRDYQAQAVDSVFRDFESVQSTLVVCPTGTGKMLIGADVIRRAHETASNGDVSPAIFLAHREELLHQAKSTIARHSGLECEYELAGSRASEIFPANVLLASVQTLISGRGDARRMHKFSPFNYNLIVIDEVHHATAASYRKVIDYFKANKDVKILGLTATPERTDEEALGQIFESVAFDYSIFQAITDGWLVPVQQQLVEINGLDFSHVRTTAGDLNGADLAAVMEAERNLYGVCDATIKELGDNSKGIMFTASVAQAKLACEILNRYRSGVACWASGSTPKDDRRRIIRDFREGKHQLFVNCNLVSEGFDIPEAEKLFQAKPTKSRLVYTQQLGRIMRPLPGCVDGGEWTPTDRRNRIADSGKPVATVYDFVGNAGRHKLIHAIDVLGGKISDKVRELAERELRKTGTPARIDELIIEAEKKERQEKEAAERARRMRLTGRAQYSVKFIDPFDAFDIVAPPARAWDRNKHLSEKQRLLLNRQGLDPDRMSYAEGKTILNELFHRWSNNLCSLRQSALLKKHGYDPKGMTRDQASVIITQLKANGWRRAT